MAASAARAASSTAKRLERHLDTQLERERVGYRGRLHHREDESDEHHSNDEAEPEIAQALATRGWYFHSEMVQCLFDARSHAKRT
jgi:hypothetical protein